MLDDHIDRCEREYTVNPSELTKRRMLAAYYNGGRSYEAASIVMGENFFGMNHSKQLFGQLSEEDTALALRIPFLLETLISKADTHALILIPRVATKVLVSSAARLERASVAEQLDYLNREKPIQWRLVQKESSRITESMELDEVRDYLAPSGEIACFRTLLAYMIFNQIVMKSSVLSFRGYLVAATSDADAMSQSLTEYGGYFHGDIDNWGLASQDRTVEADYNTLVCAPYDRA